MKKLFTLVIALSVILLFAMSAFADSSGNFTAAGSGAVCTATPATFSASTCTNTGQCISGITCLNGLCTGAACGAGLPACPAGAFCNAMGVCEGIGGFFGKTLNGGLNIPGKFTANISTPNGQGTTLLIRPSAVTGLFTSTKLTTTINNATSDAGIQVCVFVDPQLDADGNPVPGTGLKVNPAQCVVYDQRIQQVSNTLFGNLSNCIPPPLSNTQCTMDSNCPAGNTCTVQSCSDGVACPEGATCTIPAGSAIGTCSFGFCQAPAPACSFEILLTTLSAHSFDYVVPVGNGLHKVFMTWQMLPGGSGTTAACFGPAEFTVVQVKNFKNDDAINFP